MSAGVRYMEDKYGCDLDETVKYYDEHAQEFIDSTIHADISELYRTFEERITPGCRILDLGCGSGGDSKYFADRGYNVVAIDLSAKMCEQTRKWKRYFCMILLKKKFFPWWTA